MSSLRIEPFPWLAAGLGGENPQPIFRDRTADMPVQALANLPEAKRQGMGQSCGRRLLPYRMQDRYDRNRQMRDFRGVVLENEILKAVFLPELGGRLMSLFHKPTNRELLYRNPVFQPANLAVRDAWFAGGIEWNVGQFGHAFHTCSPVFAGAIPGLEGGRGLRLYDYERLTGLFWQIDFHLPDGAEFLYAFTRVTNLRNQASQMYWWTNTAVPESPDVRVLAPTNDAIYVDMTRFLKENQLYYGQMELPGLPTIDGRDGTYSTNLPFASEFYFQCQPAEMPWEAALDGRGSGFVEASTHPLDTRKLFCWGMHQGGRHWQEFLAVPGQAYLEIQAGLAPTQVHGLTMPPASQWSWTQAFGHLEADPAKIHGQDWSATWRTADAALKQKLSPATLNRIQADCRALADVPPQTILNSGSGWGALESRRRMAASEPAVPAAFTFPETTIGPEQQRWLTLLATGQLPEADPTLAPGEWMIQPEWRSLLEQSLQEPENRHWFSLLHLGVMRIEAFDEAGALAAWEESLRLQPSAWAWRNLGALEMRRGQPIAAISHYRKAWELAAAAGTPDVSFAQELLGALHAAGENDQAWKFWQGLPPVLQAIDSLRILAAKIAFARDDLDFVEITLAGDYASLREGARDLTDLWYGFQAKRLAAASGRPFDDTLRRQVEKDCPPPARIDFRVVD